VAAAYLLENISPEYLKRVKLEYQKRRDVLFDCLTQIPGVKALKPQGAFYTVVKLPVEHAEKFASFLLSDFSDNGATVFVAPAAGFYTSHFPGLNKIRIAYVLNTEDIVKAANLLEKALSVYKE
jgi:aspartate aminotransferase